MAGRCMCRWQEGIVIIVADMHFTSKEYDSGFDELLAVCKTVALCKTQALELVEDDPNLVRYCVLNLPEGFTFHDFLKNPTTYRIMNIAGIPPSWGVQVWQRIADLSIDHIVLLGCIAQSQFGDRVSKAKVQVWVQEGYKTEPFPYFPQALLKEAMDRHCVEANAKKCVGLVHNNEDFISLDDLAEQLGLTL